MSAEKSGKAGKAGKKGRGKAGKPAEPAKAAEAVNAAVAPETQASDAALPEGGVVSSEEARGSEASGDRSEVSAEAAEAPAIAVSASEQEPREPVLLPPKEAGTEPGTDLAPEPAAPSTQRELAGQFAAIPEEPDPPSYAPILTGIGIAVFAWGFLTAPFIGLVGLFLFATGMTIWIKELTHHEP